MCTGFKGLRVPTESINLLANLWQWLLALYRECVPLSGVLERMHVSCKLLISNEPMLVAAVLDVMTWLQEGLHWSKMFTSRLDDEVKLVGSTISCESAHKGGIFGNDPRHIAHVQSYVMATDQVGSPSALRSSLVGFCEGRCPSKPRSALGCSR